MWERESGRTLELAIGQEFHVSLPSNPSTGFSWAFECLPEGIVVALGEPEYLPDAPELVGSGGVEAYRFRGVRAGRTTIAFEYRRPWETDAAPEDTATYYVRVTR